MLSTGDVCPYVVSEKVGVLHVQFLPHIEQKTENITARSPKPE